MTKQKSFPSTHFLWALYFFLSPFSTAYSSSSEDYPKLRDTHNAAYGRLARAQLNGWNLARSNLEHADLTNADLRGVNFRDANLRSTTITDANLYGADLRGAQGADHFPRIYLLRAPGRISFLKKYNLELLTCGKTDLEFIRHKGLPQGVLQFALGYLNEIYGDPEQVIKLYEESAAVGILEAFNNLGWIYEWGYGVPCNLDHAKFYYEKAKAHPMALFNLCRYEAMYENNPIAQYSLAKLYENGPLNIRYNSDLTQAFSWCHKAAQQGYRDAEFRLGAYYRSGMGVTKDLGQAFTWIERAAMHGHIEAYSLLAELYEFGKGTQQNLIEALKWYEKAGLQGDTNALGKAGDFYAKGLGTAHNFSNALKFYLKMSQHDSITGQYNAGLMYEHLDNYESARKLYEAIQSKHLGALFRLASLYERGKGVEPNREKAKEIYQALAKKGHGSAKIKLALLNEIGRREQQEQEDFLTTLQAESEPYAQATANWIQEECAKNYTISSYALTEDYGKVMHKVNTLQAEDNGSIRLNYLKILHDPYLFSIFQSLDQDEITDEEISTPFFQALFTDLAEGYQTHPSYNPLSIPELSRIFSKFYIPAQDSLRKAFLKLYRKLISGEGRIELPEILTDENAIKRYRNGHIASLLIQNSDRCPDGIARFINDEMWNLISYTQTNAHSSSQTGVPLGFLISRIITAHKYDVLKLYRNPLPEAYEEATEASRLLEERLRLSFGLPQNFMLPLYPQLGFGNDSKYKPANFIKRFFKGGILHFSRLNASEDIEIPACTPDLLVDLLINAHDKKLIKDETLIDFAQKDPLSKSKFNQAFMEFEENDFFNPDSDRGSAYKRAFFVRILQAHGYIIIN